VLAAPDIEMLDKIISFVKLRLNIVDVNNNQMKKFSIEAERVSGYLEQVAKEVKTHSGIVSNCLLNSTIFGQVTGLFSKLFKAFTKRIR
jgi:indole-3-glycerol phosphate synthase